MSYGKEIITEIAKLYYEEGMTQAEISTRLGISRPIVSRRLMEARESGIVKIFISSNEVNMTDLERRLFSTFNLKGVKVVDVPEDDGELAVELTARAGADYLKDFLEPGDCVGVDWGWTINMLTSSFSQYDSGVDTVVQCAGNMNDVQIKSSPDGTIKAFAAKLRAKHAYSLSVPIMVENRIIANTLRYDKRIEQTLNCLDRCNKFIVNIALAGEGSCLYNLGYINDSDVARLNAEGVLGSICCRFFNSEGKICDTDLEERTISISLNQLKKAECVMSCLSGKKKAPPVYYALRHGLINVAVLDSLLATSVLDLAAADAAR